MDDVYFGNCIIDGNLSTEISFQKNNDGVFNYTFDNCLIKIDPDIDTETPNYINIIKNEIPNFANKKLFDFHLSEESPCNQSGDFNITQTEFILFSDIDGIPRQNPPDIGAFERNN